MYLEVGKQGLEAVVVLVWVWVCVESILGLVEVSFELGALFA